MPTNTDRIRELEMAEVALRVRLQTVESWRDHLDRLAEETTKNSREIIEKAAQLAQDIAVLNQKTINHEKILDRVVQQRFTIWVAILSAFVGAFLGFASQYMVRLLTK